MDVEARYCILLDAGDIQAGLFWRRDPGNFASLPADVGGAVRDATGF